MGWTSDFFGAVFQTMGLSIVKTKKKVNGKDVNGQFVTGMKFTESEITNN